MSFKLFFLKKFFLGAFSSHYGAHSDVKSTISGSKKTIVAQKVFSNKVYGHLYKIMSQFQETCSHLFNVKRSGRVHSEVIKFSQIALAWL